MFTRMDAAFSLGLPLFIPKSVNWFEVRIDLMKFVTQSPRRTGSRICHFGSHCGGCNDGFESERRGGQSEGDWKLKNISVSTAISCSLFLITADEVSVIRNLKRLRRSFVCNFLPKPWVQPHEQACCSGSHMLAEKENTAPYTSSATPRSRPRLSKRLQKWFGMHRSKDGGNGEAGRKAMRRVRSIGARRCKRRVSM